ncbi:MAG TPA: hypothetical protein VFP40_14140 [Terriglobales bacterium]|nr:hypothetical protein [Terriglobales bacterium]
MDQVDRFIADAILGIDTLWGGDVMCASGTGRFIADSWFSDEPLPAAYTVAPAAKLREVGGVTAKNLDDSVVDDYLKQVDLPAAISSIASAATKIGGVRGKYLAGLAQSLQVMFELAMEILGRGPAVPYARCVEASCGHGPVQSQPQAKRARIAELLSKAGYPTSTPEELLQSVDAWRKPRNSPMASVRSLGAAVIALFDQLTVKNVLPHLPRELHAVPRANIEFLPIKDAWFSGSMNYVGRARNADRTPRYEATYEINASLSISYPEFEQLVSHEVVPGHVTTFAYLQNLYVRGLTGFESTVLTMNTRCATLSEGIANNGILMAHGVNEIEQLEDEDLQIGVLLALLQDDAKNQSSYLTWGEGRKKDEVAKVLRRDFFVSDERADKLSGAWGQHPLLGRMYLPAYRSGTELVARLRREYPAGVVLPAIYGCFGIVDCVTVEDVIKQKIGKLAEANRTNEHVHA